MVSGIKVLIISHNPFSTYQNMGKTFTALFSSFKKEQLCQLYIYPSFPDVDAVNSCYRITDKDAIKAIIKRKSVGKEVSFKPYKGEMLENKIDYKFYSKSSNNMPLKRLVRDFAWKISNWYSNELEKWLEKEKPTCIFLAPGYAKFIYDIALKISKIKNIPIVTYICDDNFFVDKPKTFLGRYQLKLLQKKTRQIMDNTKLLVTISEEIRQKYYKAFGIQTEVVMTGSNISLSTEIPQKEAITSLSYFGNVDLNRHISLADIGRALDEINNKTGKNYCLKIYTKEDSFFAKPPFLNIKSVRKCDFLVGEEFLKEFLKSDILIHVESFDDNSINLVKGSISTKIADSLASGIPLLAYGPKNIASINYLRRNDCAFIANGYDELLTVLQEIFNNGQKRKEISITALNVAKMNHISTNNSNRLKSFIEQL